MEQVVESVRERLNLGSTRQLNKLLVLDISKKTVLHSENLPDPAQYAVEVWNMWQTATRLIEPTDQSADQMIQIRSGAQQTILFSDTRYLLLASIEE